MTYFEKTRLTNEEMVYQGRLSKIVFFWPTVFTVVTMGIGFPVLLIPYLDYISSEFVVTNKRVILKRGFISRRTVEILIEKVERVTVDQGWIGRALGYGSLVVGGTGGSHGRFDRIDNPLEFRRQVHETIEMRASGKRTAATAAQ